MSELGEQAVDPVSDGVALLIQRMKSHPEEFDVEHGKWQHVLQSVHERVHRIYKPSGVMPDAWMSDHEVRSIWSAYTALKQKRFHSWVMEKLLVNDGEKEEYFGKAALDKAMAKRGLLVNPPGSWQTVRSEVVDTPLAIALKRKLEAMWTR